MAHKISKKQNNKKMATFPFPYYILMLPCFMGLAMLLIVYGYRIKIDEVFYPVTIGPMESIDVFLRGKQMWLYLTVAVALFLILCFKLLERKIWYPKKWMIFGCVYLGLSFISALTSESVKIAFFGGVDFFQGFWVLVSYMVLAYYLYLIFSVENENQVKMITVFFRSVLAVSVILVMIGILQISGNDPFSWEWLRKIINIENTSIVSNRKIYLTLYNSNYVGVLTITILPILFAGLLRETKLWWKIIFGITALGMLVCLFASGSKIALILAFVLALAFCLWEIIRDKKYKKMAMVFAIVILVVGIITAVVKKDEFISANRPVKQNRNAMDGFVTDADGIYITIDGEKMKIYWDSAKIYFENEKGETCRTKKVSKIKREKLLKKLSPAMTNFYGENTFAPRKIKNRTFRKIVYFKSGLKLKEKNLFGYVFYIQNMPYFVTTDRTTGEYFYYNLAGRFVQAADSADAFPESIYGLASNRGYIWSKTIPLLKKTIFLGNGMDQFALLFPNQDYAAKAKIHQTGTVYNKPHNSYLQMATDSGVFAAICLIIMIVMILLEGAKSGKDTKRITENDDNVISMLISCKK